MQVEHPVTEAVTGIDLVKLQLRIAGGEPLPFSQREVALRGHAVECRIYAEDPDNNFFPSPGKITSWRAPHGPGIRLDEGVYAGWTVPGDYDPLLAKLIAFGADREEALARLRRALGEFIAGGIKTNAQLFMQILSDAGFPRNEIHTRWLDEWLISRQTTLAERPPHTGQPNVMDAAAIAAVLWHIHRSEEHQDNHNQPTASRWKIEGRREQVSRDPERPI